jgi:hypothetical protein
MSGASQEQHSPKFVFVGWDDVVLKALGEAGDSSSPPTDESKYPKAEY